MKKTVLVFLSVFMILFILAGCNTDNVPEDNSSKSDSSTSTVENTTESNVTTEAVDTENTETAEAIEGNSNVTVDGIVELFAKDYSSQKYTDEMISYIRNNLANMGVILSGDITAIVHLTKKASSPELSDWSWAYVYQFADESDAVAFEESRRALSSSSADGEVCVRLGLIVVFGTATIISSIS